MGRSRGLRKLPVALLAGACALWFAAAPASADAGPSTVQLTVQNTSPMYGNVLSFRAQVAGTGVPTGTVTFLDGVTTLGTGVVDATGVASFVISTLVIGTHNITASYGGDADNAPSVSPVLVVSVFQRTVTDLIVYSHPKSPAPTWTPTTPILLVANVMRGKPVGTKKLQPTGSVTFTLDGVQTTVPVGGLHDAEMLVPNGLSLGAHVATAVFNGDPIFGPSVSPKRTFHINRNLVTSITDAPDPVVAGSNVTYTVTVKNSGLAAVKSEQIVDTLPAGATLVSATAALGCTGVGPVTCSFGKLLVNASVTATIVVQSPATVPPDATMTDTATALLGLNNIATQTTTVDASP